MHKSKLLLSVSLLFFAKLSAFSQSSTIKVEIEATQTAVKKNESFSVSTALYNTSREVQVLEVMSCSYPTQWEVDNPSVFVNQVGCLRNVLSRIRLNPGEGYKRPVSIQIKLIDRGMPIEPVTFRLGFQDDNPGAVPKPKRIWSNAVTVSVKR
jgi:hypothetical protein